MLTEATAKDCTLSPCSVPSSVGRKRCRTGVIQDISSEVELANCLAEAGSMQDCWDKSPWTILPGEETEGAQALVLTDHSSREGLSTWGC
jgi:hypothetical protein